MIIAFTRLACQPVDPEEERARRARRWRLVILILVAAAVAGLLRSGSAAEGALVLIVGVVSVAHVTARFVLGRSTPQRFVPRRV